jgi:hypothetical protein
MQDINQKDKVKQGRVLQVIGSLFILYLIVIGILWLFRFNFGSTNEGVVKYDDCRQIITLKSDDWQANFHKFTCTTRKTQSGAVMGGECVRIENDGFMGSSPTCAVAYVYEIPSSTVCKDNTKDGVSYPYLGYNDNCYTTPQ